MPSLQDGAAQKPPEHDLEAQSAPTLQREPAEQRAQLVWPPQSTPVSSPFRLPSKQLGGSHRFASGLQLPEVQSRSSWHDAKSPHAGQVGPPPSTHVSSPPLTPSVHVGSGAQTPDTHNAVEQSSADAHFRPTAQRLQALTLEGTNEPAVPQSTSVSREGSRIPSWQVGAWHVALVHAPPVEQSAATRQDSPSWHLCSPGRLSTQGSSPLRTPSLSEAGAQIPGFALVRSPWAAPTALHTRERHWRSNTQAPKSATFVVELSTS